MSVVRNLLRVFALFSLRQLKLPHGREASPDEPERPAPAALPVSGSQVGFFSRTRFEGRIVGAVDEVPVSFFVSIDLQGNLVIEFVPTERMAASSPLLRSSGPGTPISWLRLEGESMEGRAFRSTSFYLTGHSMPANGGIALKGSCAQAELTLRSDQAEVPNSRVWLLRRFQGFHRISYDTPLGTVSIGLTGSTHDEEPSGYLAIDRSRDYQGDAWWEESERLLTHVARVLSFAQDTYLRPVIEECYDDTSLTVCLRQLRTSAPYLAPFHYLHLEPIFRCACESFLSHREDVADLDAAIRWLTAPVMYEESRLINAMTALENLLERNTVPGLATFVSTSGFRKIAKKVRALLLEIDAPASMATKVPELNRRPLAEKVGGLLTGLGVVTSDFPDGWLEPIIRQRNEIVHTGLSESRVEDNEQIFRNTVLVREVVSRIILHRLRFCGAYNSWLHHDTQLHFPECVPMTEWAADRGLS